jgi:hypothetical protein
LLQYPDQLTKNIYIVWHTWSGDHKSRYQSIIGRQWRTLLASKLAEHASKIFISLREGDQIYLPQSLLDSNQVELNFFSGPVHEGFTLNWLKNQLDQNRLDDDSLILYFHSRGASKALTTREAICSDDWTVMMEYFCLARWRFAVNHLANHYTCGCQLWPMASSFDQGECSIYHSSYPREFWTYCGNFWWANGSYIKHLLNPPDFYSTGESAKDRHLMENWILSSVGTLTNFDEHYILHSTGYPYQRGLVHSYLDRYHPRHYVRGDVSPMPSLDPDLFNGECNTRSSIRSKIKRWLAKITSVKDSRTPPL